MTLNQVVVGGSYDHELVEWQNLGRSVTTMLWALLGSFIVINVLHSYLLITHRANDDLTISERAAKNTSVHTLYILGHLVGGSLAGIFGWLLFMQAFDSPLLFGVTILGIVMEWLQAFIPARNQYEKYHLVLAYAMSALMTLLGILAALLLPIGDSLQRTLLTISALILLGYPAVILLPKRYFWRIEMININLFYLQMLLLGLHVAV